jgi:basic membrane protein A
MLRSFSAVFAALLLALFAAAGCGGDDNAGGEGAGTGAQTSDTGGGEPIKVGFLYIGPPGDAGWTFQHDEGRKYVEEQLPNAETTFLDSVPEANSGPAIDQLVAQGNKVIFATSFGYGDTVIQKAKQYPDVVFEHATGLQRADNVSTYFVQHWEPSFLLGMIAGRMTKTNHLGYVGSFPIPEVIRDVNSFTLGAQSVNPDVKVQVVLISTWFDPPKEKQAAKSLIDAGADVLFGIEDSPSVLQEAAANNAYAATWNSDMSRFGPPAFLSAVELEWGKHYVDRVKAALDGTWKPGFYYGSINDGFTRLAPYGPSVTAKTKAAIAKKRAALVKGTFYEFAGPLYDQKGKLRVPKGKRLTVKDLYAMNGLVKGVIGSAKG